MSRRLRSIRSHTIDILHQSNFNRVIAFKRWSADEEVIILTSLNDAPFANGYVIEKDALATLSAPALDTLVGRSIADVTCNAPFLLAMHNAKKTGRS
jgi:hypothetical protein